VSLLRIADLRDEVLGQPAVSHTLKNAIEGGRIAQAYLFTGPRGVGKTTMARILAKALNCVKGPTFKPCGECLPCKEIAASSCLDVLEMDAASNTGVDNVRQVIIETVALAPARDLVRRASKPELDSAVGSACQPRALLLFSSDHPGRDTKSRWPTTNPVTFMPSALPHC
jgi:energy-coupling factor transporter ATP-binding protein EcfA2